MMIHKYALCSKENKSQRYIRKVAHLKQAWRVLMLIGANKSEQWGNMICHQHAVWIYIGNCLPILMLMPTRPFTPVVFRVFDFCGRVETAPGPEANTCFLCGLVHSILYGHFEEGCYGQRCTELLT